MKAGKPWATQWYSSIQWYWGGGQKGPETAGLGELILLWTKLGWGFYFQVARFWGSRSGVWQRWCISTSRGPKLLTVPLTGRNKVWCTHGKDMTFIHNLQTIHSQLVVWIDMAMPLLSKGTCIYIYTIYIILYIYILYIYISRSRWLFIVAVVYRRFFRFLRACTSCHKIWSSWWWASAIGPSAGPTCTWKGEENVSSTGAGAFGLQPKPWRFNHVCVQVITPQ